MNYSSGDPPPASAWLVPFLLASQYLKDATQAVKKFLCSEIEFVESLLEQAQEQIRILLDVAVKLEAHVHKQDARIHEQEREIARLEKKISHERTHQLEFFARWDLHVNIMVQASKAKKPVPKDTLDFLFCVKDWYQEQWKHPDDEISLYNFIPTSCEDVNCQYKGHRVEFKAVDELGVADVVFLQQFTK